MSAGKCNGGDIKTDWLLTQPAVVKLEDVICPDGSECQDGQTCCEMNNGITSYGCCPLPNVWKLDVYKPPGGILFNHLFCISFVIAMLQFTKKMIYYIR